MENKYDILLLYGPPWDQPAKLSKHHFARLWAESNQRVLYVEGPINIFSFITRRKESIRLWRRYKNGPEKISNNLWVTTFFYLLPFRGNRYLFGAKWVNRLNQFFIINKLKKQLNKLGFINPLLFISVAHALPLLKEFEKSIKIYHCSDDYNLVTSFPDVYSQIENELIAKCNLTIATSDELKKEKERSSSNILSIPNGATTKHFAQTQNPDLKVAVELKNINKPIVGYIGSVFRWINVDWIDYAARENQNYNFVFIGPITTDISKLSGRENIYFLGPRPYTDLPKYLKCFNVATIPFTIDGVTLKASPIKFYEYLASGVPIVSTSLPDLEIFKSYCSLVSTKEDFSNELTNSIKFDNEMKKHERMKLAENFSWESRFAQLRSEINKNIL